MSPHLPPRFLRACAALAFAAFSIFPTSHLAAGPELNLRSPWLPFAAAARAVEKNRTRSPRTSALGARRKRKGSSAYSQLSVATAPPTANPQETGVDNQIAANPEQRGVFKTCRKEASLLLKIAGPSVVVQLLAICIWFENAIYAGNKLGTTSLAAVSLSNLTGNLTGLSLILGMCSAMDTLGPQAMGAGNFREVGLLTQRCGATQYAIFQV